MNNIMLYYISDLSGPTSVLTCMCNNVMCKLQFKHVFILNLYTGYNLPRIEIYNSF